MAIDPPWKAEPIPAPGFKVTAADGVELVFIYVRRDDTANLPAGGRKLPSERQGEWLADLIADLPNMVRIEDDVREALERYIKEQPDLKASGAAASYLLRDALIGLGLLPLGEGNRSKGARRTRPK